MDLRNLTNPLCEETIERRYRTFVDALIETGGDRRAALKAAGYKSDKPRSADSKACQLLRVPEVVSILEERLDAMARARAAEDRLAVAQAKTPEIIKEFERIALARDDDRVKVSDQLQAGQLLLRMKGLLSSPGVTVNTAVQVNTGSDPISKLVDRLYSEDVIENADAETLEALSKVEGTLRLIANRTSLRASQPEGEAIDAEYREIDDAVDDA